MEEELVSVIIPVYNTEQYLNKCVDSVLGQTYRNLEVLLVDDGSLDRSGVMCDQYAQMDPRVRVIHKDNGGLSDARNVALDQINGKYVAFIDSDDWVSDNWVDKLVSACIDNGAGISVGGVCGVSMGRFKYAPLLYKNQVLKQPDQMIQYICSADLRPTVTNKIYAVELFKKLRFPYGKIHEDAFVSPVLLGANQKTAIVDGCYYYIRIREDSITHREISEKKVENAREVNEETLVYYKCNYPELERLATMKYINAQFGLLKTLFSTKNPELFADQIETVEMSMIEKIQRLSKISGLEFGYKLSGEIEQYIHNKEKFKRNCVRLRTKDQIKAVIKKVLRFLIEKNRIVHFKMRRFPE